MIEILSCGPLVTVQDQGRPGHLAQGLAQGGAADPRARVEAAALLGHDGAGIELPGAPLRLRLDEPAMVALTGAPMQARTCDGPLPWHSAHAMPAGTVLDLRPTGQGVYSYVHLSGGLRTEAVLGSRSAHLIAGIGRPLAAGDRIPFEVTALGPALTLTAPESRFEGGPLRVLPTPQTALFPPEEQARFEATTFTRDRRGNRQGVRLAMEDAGFATEGQLSLLSDFILPGDVQMTGDGVPYILGPECQTTGGYPRIGTVIAADLPRALQAPPGASLSFQFVTQTQALAARPDAPAVTPLIRDPATMSDLLSYQLIDGVQSARD